MTDKFDRTIFEQAGVQPRHLLPFMNVSRPTISSWLNSDRQPHKFIAADVLALQAAVKSALDAGDLPLQPTEHSLSERTRRVVGVIRQHLDP